MDHPPVQGGTMRLCAGCDPLGRCRVGLRDERFEDGVLSYRGRCGPEWEGAGGLAHGGWTAAVLDDACGRYWSWSAGPRSAMAVAVTGTLRVTFVKPVPIERDVVVVVRLRGIRGSRWFVHGEVRLGATDELLAGALGVFVERDRGHFSRARDWVAAVDGGRST